MSSKTIETNHAKMSALISRSQNVGSVLQATQVSNLLLALQAQQLADPTAVIAANG